MVDATPDRSDGVERDRTRRFPFLALLAWGLFAFAVPWFAQTLDAVDVLAFPLGFFMAAQGSLIAFLVIAVLSARRQKRIANAADGQT